jgi:hypothetical protein
MIGRTKDLAWLAPPCCDGADHRNQPRKIEPDEPAAGLGRRLDERVRPGLSTLQKKINEPEDETEVGPMNSTGRAQAAGKRAANSKPLEVAARIGFVARGLIYVLIGVIAVQIALGNGGQADRGGAIAQIASKSFGTAVLWALVVGFLGLALWRLSEAAFGATGPDGDKASERLKSLFRAVMYGSFFVTTLKFVLGSSSGATHNSNDQSKSATAQVMSHTGGRFLIGLVGVIIVVVGGVLVKEGWTEEFLKKMHLADVSATVRSTVKRLGVVGGVARGVVIALAGVFLIVAAVRFNPSQAEGIDGTLRSFAHTPLGPWLLIVVALGLIAFGVFSWCEARWRRV